MSNGNGNGSRFNQWAANGVLVTIAWVVILIIYCTFKVLEIDDPFIGGTFQTLTGAWIGFLTLAMARRSQKDREDLEKLKAVAIQQHPEIAGDLNE